jgi:hypothetical protein
MSYRPRHAQCEIRVERKKKYITYHDKRDVAPVSPHKLSQPLANSSDLLNALTLPDPLRKVRSMIEELVRLKKMQRRRVQVLLISHTMRRVVQQPRELSITIELENRGHATGATRTERRRRHCHLRVNWQTFWWCDRRWGLRDSCATIKQHISTPVIHPFIAKHILGPHSAHSFIVNVQPSFLTTVSVWVEHIDRIVPGAWGLAVVVKHPIQHVVHRLRRFPGNGCHDFWTRGILSLG